MSNDTILMPHERGWAVLHNGTLTKVYPSRHLAMQKLKDEMSRRLLKNQRTHQSEPTHPVATGKRGAKTRSSIEPLIDPPFQDEDESTPSS
ncbi:hypothetical protein [Agrobacterium cavarae]|uniref:hypothetical protein n=1 Tax=Agrobacterium cavarae TaxID=2528239 RepID=UPI002FF9A07A